MANRRSVTVVSAITVLTFAGAQLINKYYSEEAGLLVLAFVLWVLSRQQVKSARETWKDLKEDMKDSGFLIAVLALAGIGHKE